MAIFQSADFRCIPVYGVSGMFSDIDDVRAHGKDERIGVREFYEGVGVHLPVNEGGGGVGAAGVRELYGAPHCFDGGAVYNRPEPIGRPDYAVEIRRSVRAASR